MTPTPNPIAEIRALIAPILARIDPDKVATHGPDCYQWHVECLALAVQRRLSEGAPSEEQIEAAAKALAGISQETSWSSCEVWGDLDEWVDGYRSQARAALTAAGVAPQELTLCVECGETEVLGKPEHRVLCMDCAYETGVHAGRRTLALDPEKVAEALEQAMRDEAMLFDNGDEEWIAESDPVECLPPLARALCEAYTEGKLTA